MKKKIKLAYVDQWHRGVYTCVETGQRYVDLDGTLHTMSADYDEPIEPVSFEFELCSHFKDTQEEISEEQAKYLKSEGLHCPNCGETTAEAYGPFEIDTSVGTQKVECTKCSATWTDSYKLISFTDLEVPK